MMKVVFLFTVAAAGPALAADAVTFEILQADCSGASTYELLVNGDVIDTVPAEAGCACNDTPQVHTYTDPATLALLNGDCDRFAVRQPATNYAALAQVRVTVHDGGASASECLYDGPGGGICTPRDMCAGGTYAFGLDLVEDTDDADGDGIVGGGLGGGCGAAGDNCPDYANPDQADADGDLRGDACDNCPATANAAQGDLDEDGQGDACDADPDGDGAIADDCAPLDGSRFPGNLEVCGDGVDNDCDGEADEPGCLETFATDVNAAIDDGLDHLRRHARFGGACDWGAGLPGLALLEKRANASFAAPIVGYEGSSVADQARARDTARFVVDTLAGRGFYAYGYGTSLMYLALYARTGGPDVGTVRTLADAMASMTDATLNSACPAGHPADGFWGYFGCDSDSSTTQFAAGGLSAARGYFLAVGDAARVGAIDATLARTAATYARSLAASPDGLGGRGLGYHTSGYDPSYQQTASALFVQLLAGSTLADAGPAAAMQWMAERYNYTNIAHAQNWWGTSYYYSLFHSSKAYSLIEDAQMAPAAGGWHPDMLGTLAAGGPRLAHRDPASDPRPAARGAGGPGYYAGEAPRWYYDYAYTLMTQQDADGRFVAPAGGWESCSEQAYAILVLQRAIAGACVDGDDDGVCDAEDNCPDQANPGQEDADADGLGDACETGCGSAADCADGDLCTDDVCNADGSCSNPPLSCDDGLGCTEDACVAGACVHTAMRCGDDDACTTDRCVEPGFCVSEPIDCDDGDACTLDTCSEGVCGHAPQCPDCGAAAPTVASIWPPNGRMVEVGIAGVTDPQGQAAEIRVTAIRQDEPTSERGCRRRDCADADGVGAATARVRAERDGGHHRSRGDGRVYHIEYTATDPDGNACTGTVQVCVPHDQGHDRGRRRGHGRDRDGDCVDQGPLYDSLVCAP